jgi:16S rRNA (cytosine1402-N4)-methyltransferase
MRETVSNDRSMYALLRAPRQRAPSSRRDARSTRRGHSEVATMVEADDSIHVPVQPEAVLEYLAPREDETVLDGTVGMGGHAARILAATTRGKLIGLDRDADALAVATPRLTRFGDRVVLHRANFERFAEFVGGIKLGGAVLDLGFSSLQVDRAARGFTYQDDGPLDMRMDAGAGTRTAADLLNRAPHAELLRIVREYGDEPAAKRIVDAVVVARGRAPLRRTCELRDIVERALRTRSPEVLTRTLSRVFMGLRIAVNDELGVLERTLPRIVDALAPLGRLVVLTFHSGEDRIVKQCLQASAEHGIGRVLTARPIEPTASELARNPRSRSSKLRALERLAVGR